MEYMREIHEFSSQRKTTKAGYFLIIIHIFIINVYIIDNLQLFPFKKVRTNNLASKEILTDAFNP